MNSARVLLAAAILLPLPAVAQDALTSLHPEAAYPDNAPPLTSPGRWSGLVRQVQQKLHEHGFDAGPVNGDLNSKTQAAIAQFQLSIPMPVNGMLDEPTLAALGVGPGSTAPQEDASTGR